MMARELRRFLLRTLATDPGRITLAWLVTVPPNLFLRYVMETPAWLLVVTAMLVYAITYLSLPGVAEAARRLERLDAEDRLR